MGTEDVMKKDLTVPTALAVYGALAIYIAVLPSVEDRLLPLLYTTLVLGGFAFNFLVGATIVFSKKQKVARELHDLFRVFLLSAFVGAALVFIMLYRFPSPHAATSFLTATGSVGSISLGVWLYRLLRR
jgi:hypothetical protein